MSAAASLFQLYPNTKRDKSDVAIADVFHEEAAVYANARNGQTPAPKAMIDSSYCSTLAIAHSHNDRSIMREKL